MTPYEIRQYNEKTDRSHFLTMIYAASPEDAKQKFIERSNYKPRKGLVLFVKTPGCL